MRKMLRTLAAYSNMVDYLFGVATAQRSPRITLSFVGTAEAILNVEHIIGEAGSKFKPGRTAKITSCDTRVGRMLGGKPYCQWNHVALRELLPQLRFRTSRMEQRR